MTLIEKDSRTEANEKPAHLQLGRRPIVTFAQIAAAGLLVVTVVIGFILPRLPAKMQYALTLAVPGAIMGIAIVLNPFIGVCAYFMYDYTRPDYFIPALQSLKLAILIEALTLGSAIFYYVKKNRRLNRHYFSIVYLIFLFVMGLGTITAMNNRYAYDTFQLILVNFVIFLIATNVVDSFKRLNILIWILLIINTFFAVKGIQTGGLVGGSLMGDENDFALALNIMIPFAFFLFINTPTKLKGLIGLAMLNFLTLGVVSSLSRGGWVGLVAVLGYCFVMSKRKMLSLGIGVVLALAVVFFAPPAYWAEIKTITNPEESTAQSRLHYWEAAWRMFEANPLIGVGGGNGTVRMPEFVRDMGDSSRQWGRTFHGTLPQVMAELGGMGLASYLLMTFLALRYLYKILRSNHGEYDEDAKRFANSIMGGIIGFMVTAIFLSTAYYPHLWTMFTLTIILVFLTRDAARVRAAAEQDLPEASFASINQTA